jgi:hypothetical protein
MKTKKPKETQNITLRSPTAKMPSRYVLWPFQLTDDKGKKYYFISVIIEGGEVHAIKDRLKKCNPMSLIFSQKARAKLFDLYS